MAQHLENINEMKYNNILSRRMISVASAGNISKSMASMTKYQSSLICGYLFYKLNLASQWLTCNAAISSSAKYGWL